MKEKHAKMIMGIFSFLLLFTVVLSVVHTEEAYASDFPEVTVYHDPQ